MEGGIVDGIAAALYQKIEVRDGSVVQSNLHDYPMLEMKETPEMDISLMDSTEAPDGLGEMAYPPMMAATASALCAATGKRTFDLPIRG
jgi:CO/xanthine dehydrogenase Mo-binding subunit